MSCQGIESNFLKSWEGWDEISTGDLLFDGVVLREDVFGSTICDKYNGGTLTLLGSHNTIQLYKSGEEEYIEYKMRITLQPVETNND